MAKTKKIEPEFPSVFGSHTSMIDADETAKLTDPNLVAIRDEHGVYITERKRLDTGLADPNRYVSSRLEKLFGKREKKEEQRR